MTEREIARGAARRQPRSHQGRPRRRRTGPRVHAAGELAILLDTDHAITPSVIDTTIDFLLRHVAV